MTRNLSSLRGAHLVMWSSPLLLVVLVFTLTSTSSPLASPMTKGHQTVATTTTSTPIPTPTPIRALPSTTSTTIVTIKKSTRRTLTTLPMKKVNYADVTSSSATAIVRSPDTSV